MGGLDTPYGSVDHQVAQVHYMGDLGLDKIDGDGGESGSLSGLGDGERELQGIADYRCA